MPLTFEERENFRANWNKVRVAVIQGDLLEITYVTHNKAPRFPGKRSTIKGFTASARIRMFKTLARVRWDDVGPCLFVTLTYPDDRVRSLPSERTRDRHLFLRDVENYLGRKVAALWRLEWIDRKSGSRKGTMEAHVHLIVFGCKFLPWQVVSRSWRAALRAVGPLDTKVQKIDAEKKVAYYVAKYAGKKPSPNVNLDIASYLNTGRAWGIHRKDLIPWHERIVTRITNPDDVCIVENAACMTFPYFVRDSDSGFALFGPLARKVIDRITRTDLDEFACPE